MFDLQTIQSVATVVVPIITIVLTCIQIWQANKLKLLDRRLRVWGIVSGLMNLCKDYRNSLEEELTIRDDGNKLNFVFMTNNTFLYEITPAIDSPFEEGPHQDLLKKLEEMKSLSFEAKIIFRHKEARLVSEFIDRYQKNLFQRYLYQRLLKKIDEDAANPNLNNGVPYSQIEKLTTDAREPEHRNQLNDSTHKLFATYDELTQNSVAKKIQNQMRVLIRPLH